MGNLKKDLIGKVVHYYDKIGVAVIKLEKGLKTGDKVKFVKGNSDFVVIMNYFSDYDKIGVAVIKLEKGLKTGDKVKFVKGDHEFEQTADSMQLEYKEIKEGKKGDEIALKVDKEAGSGTLVYKA